MASIRLDKYISQALGLTRQEAKQVLKKGLITAEGKSFTKGDEKIDPNNIQLGYNGKPIQYEEFVYYMLNKPQNVVSATNDNLHQTVVELINDPIHKEIFPVGRLDIDTEGLLLITDDGNLSHQLTAPSKHVDKVYYTRVTGKLLEEEIVRFKQGIDIGEKHLTKPAKLEILAANEEESEAKITISEGKFHQVKRMFHTCGHEVTYLKRVQMGSLILDDSLKPGEYRTLTKEEISLLKGEPYSS